MDRWIHCNKDSTCANGTSTELPGYWQNSRLRIHTGTLAEGKCYPALRRTSHPLARERDHLNQKNGARVTEVGNRESGAIPANHSASAAQS